MSHPHPCPRFAFSRPRSPGIAPITVALLLVVVASARAATITVEAGSSIQAAIDAAQPGDQIRVAPGRFREHLNFGGKALRVTGAGPTTILEGSAGGGPVVTFARGESRKAVLESLQITGGRAENGAAILVSDASPILQRLVLFRNQASEAGAGIFVTGSRAAPIIRNNLLAFNDDSSPGLTDAHQISIDSGSQATITNNTLVRGNGNAIILFGSPRASLVANNILAWNGSRLRSGAPIGRGICDFSGSARIRYNIFWDNVRAALLTDVPGGGFEDIPLIADAQALLNRARVARNFDADPALSRRPPRREPARLNVADFRPQSTSPVLRAGDPARPFRNRGGTRNTVGHTGGPFGWR